MIVSRPVHNTVSSRRSATASRQQRQGQRTAVAPSTQPRAERKSAATGNPIPSTSRQGQATADVPSTQPRGQTPVEFLNRGIEKPRVTSGTSPSASPVIGTREQVAGTGSDRDRTGSAITQRPAGGGGETPSISGTPSSSTTISWASGVNRNRIAGAMPAFPSDVHREATIKVRFSVRVDGGVHSITFLQKGEPKFEQAVLTAMRTWRFNALATKGNQDDQDGTATFVFTLK